jgi:hypothetical protein
MSNVETFIWVGHVASMSIRCGYGYGATIRGEEFCLLGYSAV